MERARKLYDQALRAFKEERASEAISLLEEAIQLEKNFPDAYEALGILYSRHGRIEEAIQLMQTLAKLEPDNIMAHTNLSRFYVAKGLIEEAEREQNEARRLSWKAELKAKKAKGEAIPAEADEEAARKFREQKIENYKKVIELDPNDVLGYFSLATTYFDGKMYGPARETFEKAVKVNPNHSPSYLGWGQSLEALGRNKDAMDVYRQGIPVADKQGDIIPMKKMETRLGRLESLRESGPNPQ